jgi:hypothetical protein
MLVIKCYGIEISVYLHIVIIYSISLHAIFVQLSYVIMQRVG